VFDIHLVTDDMTHCPEFSCCAWAGEGCQYHIIQLDTMTSITSMLNRKLMWSLEFMNEARIISIARAFSAHDVSEPRFFREYHFIH
jgi:hypothetical protein